MAVILREEEGAEDVGVSWVAFGNDDDEDDDDVLLLLLLTKGSSMDGASPAPP